MATGSMQISNALERAMNPKEPVMIGSVILSLVTAYMAKAGSLGYELSNEDVAIVVATINAIGFIIRTQYTPLKNRQSSHDEQTTTVTPPPEQVP